MTATTLEIAPVDLDKRIENVLHDKLSHFLDDITFRIGQAYDIAERAGGGGKGTVFAEDLNIKNRVFLTGYTITNNTPSAGSIAWADLHVVYNGIDYAITNGNTALQYVYFQPPATLPAGTVGTALKFSATKPVLADGDVLLFVNEAGVARNMLSDTNASLPRIVATNAIDTDALADNAVTRNQIKNNEIIAGKLATGAINNNNLFTPKLITGDSIGDKAIVADKIGDNAVTSIKVADGAISKATQITGAIITGDKMVSKTINTGQINDNAIDSTKIKDGAINRSGQIVNKVVDATNLVNGAVGSLALDDGAVNAAKLNIMRHIMY